MNVLNCTTSRELLLEADLADLQTGPLAEHLAACAECRAVAQRIVAGYRTLDAGLSGISARRKPRFYWIPLSLATAAILTLLLLPRPEPLKEPLMLTRLLSRQQPIVTPPPGRQAVVIENAKATVVWLY